MDWLVLVLLVPLILIPVIYLAGFAGCNWFFGIEPTIPYPPPNAPSDLEATATGIDRIHLSWTDNSTDATHFRIRRSDDAGMTFSLIADEEAPTTTHEDVSGLQEGEYYEYQVFAFGNGKESEGSNIVGERTLRWMTVFDLAMNVGMNGPGEAGMCLVQRIPGGLVNLGGSAVRITLRGSAVANLQLDAVFISQAAATGDAWDSADDLVQVLFRGGNAGVLVAAGQSERSDETAYALEPGKDLIVAFDIGSPGQVRRVGGVAGAQAYLRVNPTTKQAGVPDRVAGFLPAPDVDTMFIVEKIEALVKVPD